MEGDNFKLLVRIQIVTFLLKMGTQEGRNWNFGDLDFRKGLNTSVRDTWVPLFPIGYF